MRLKRWLYYRYYAFLFCIDNVFINIAGFFGDISERIQEHRFDITVRIDKINTEHWR